MKKLIINISLIIVFIIIYLLQTTFFTSFTIAEIKPNLFIILMLYIGLYMGRSYGIIYGIIYGIFIDIWIGRNIGITSICLAFIGFLGGVFDKNFSKDSRMTIMFMVLGSTIIVEVLNYLLSYMFININVEIFNFIKILVIEVIYNLIITIIIYPLIQKFGYEIENEYKGNRILTRYF